MTTSKTEKIMSMQMQIMVPLDGSRFSEQALPYAIDLAKRSAAVVHLVRVYNEPMVALSPEIAAFYSEETAREARACDMQYLSRRAEACIREGLEIRTVVIDGQTSSALSSYAQQCSIDIVIMTTHGRGGLSRAWLGSVADRLVRESHVPVVLLRPRLSVEAHSDEVARHHVLIPLDGSALSESIIPPALALGRVNHARFTLLQVVSPPIQASEEVLEQTSADTAALQEAAGEYLDRWAMRLRARGFEVATRVVVQPHPASGITEAARLLECDMIAMATHGRSGWKRMALGSVADRVMRAAPTPMLTWSAAS